MKRMSYAAVTTAMTAATTALAAGDFATARNQALTAQALMSVIPDTVRNSGGGGSQEMTWDRVAISNFIDRMQKLLNSTSGMTSSKVVICGIGPPGTRCDC